MYFVSKLRRCDWNPHRREKHRGSLLRWHNSASPWSNTFWLCCITHIKKEKKTKTKNGSPHLPHSVDIVTFCQAVSRASRLFLSFEAAVTLSGKNPGRYCQIHRLQCKRIHHRTISEWKIGDNLTTENKLTNYGFFLLVEYYLAITRHCPQNS